MQVLVAFHQLPMLCLHRPQPGTRPVPLQTPPIRKEAVLAPQAGPSAHKSGSGRIFGQDLKPTKPELGFPAALSSEAGRERGRAGHLPPRAGSEGRDPTTAPPRGRWGRRLHKVGEGRGTPAGGPGGRGGALEPGSSPPRPRGPQGASRACPDPPVPRPPPRSPAREARSFPDPEAPRQAPWRLPWAGPGRALRGRGAGERGARAPASASGAAARRARRGQRLPRPRPSQCGAGSEAAERGTRRGPRPKKGTSSPLVNTSIGLIYTADHPSPPRRRPRGPRPRRHPRHRVRDGRDQVTVSRCCSQDFQGRTMAQTWVLSTTKRRGRSSEGRNRLCGARRARGLLAAPHLGPFPALAPGPRGPAAPHPHPSMARRCARPDRPLASSAPGRCSPLPRIGGPRRRAPLTPPRRSRSVPARDGSAPPAE